MSNNRLPRFSSRTGLFPQCVVLILLSACTPSGPEARFGSGIVQAEAPGSGIEKLEQEMFRRLNRDRSERGLPPLRYDPQLADVGRAHSRDMRDHHFFEHESPNTGSLDDRLNRASYLFVTARENLAEAPDVQRAQGSLLASPGHLANIVATDTTHIGIGVVRGGVEAPENLTVTQVFAKPARAESLPSAKQTLVKHLQRARKARGNAPAARDELLETLAERHISSLDAETSPSRLGSVGEVVSRAVTEAQRKDLSAVVIAAQLLADSDSFVPPDSLLAHPKTRFGLAVRRVEGPKGRPMLQVLIVVGQ